METGVVSRAWGRVSLWRARWTAFIRLERGAPTPCISSRLSAPLAAWQQRWEPVLAATRGPGAHFADVAYWNRHFIAAAAESVECKQSAGAHKPTGQHASEWVTARQDPKAIAAAVLKAMELPFQSATSANVGSSSASAHREPLQVLHVGCGLSKLGTALAAAGHDVCDVDASDEAISASMAAAKSARESGAYDAESLSGLPSAGLQRWEVCDVTSLPENWRGKFDLVVEKGLLDSLQFGGLWLVAQAIQEVARVACAENGAVFVSLSDENVVAMRLELLEICLGNGWIVTHTTLADLLHGGLIDDRHAAAAGCQVYVAARVAGTPKSGSAETHAKAVDLRTTSWIDLKPDFGYRRRGRMRQCTLLLAVVSWTFFLSLSSRHDKPQPERPP